MKGEENRTIAGKPVKPTEMCKWMFKKKVLLFVACLLGREKLTVPAGRKWAIEKDSSPGGRRK